MYTCIFCAFFNSHWSKYTMEIESYSQAKQDLFVLKALKYKREGTFLEIGANHPIEISNTYLLETRYGWKGLMIEQNPRFVQLYESERPNSEYIIDNAVTIDYNRALENYPRDMDYLQIDLEVDNMSTLNTLLNLNDSALKTHRFAVITFEHDRYRGDFFRTRDLSRIILQDLGYVLLFPDILFFEDWYIHPDLVDPRIISNKAITFMHESAALKYLDAILK